MINRNQSLQKLFRQVHFRLYYQQLYQNTSTTTVYKLSAVLTLHTIQLIWCLAILFHSTISQASVLSLSFMSHLYIWFMTVQFHYLQTAPLSIYPGMATEHNPEPHNGERPIILRGLVLLLHHKFASHSNKKAFYNTRHLQFGFQHVLF